MSGPLTGIRIVDMTTMLSGPWAAMILADQGADVIKVEVPNSGDHVRSLGNQRAGMSAMFLNINRNKRSVTVDVKTEMGRDIVRDLAKSADVFMQNFRPGVVDRLGVGEADIRAVAPEIVYASISGFGDVGPWVGKPVYDPIIQAVSGLTTVQAGSDLERPRLIRTVLPDKLAAVTVAQSISAALVSKLSTGKGQHLRISMLDAILYFLWASDMGAQTYPGKTMSNQEAASFIDLIYETKDGHMTVAVMSNKEWIGLTKALDQPQWLDDERFATPGARDKHVNERLVLTQEILKSRTTAEWMARLEAHDVPCAPALTRNEVLTHPQVVAAGTIVEFEHHAAGRLRQARPPAQFDRTPSSIRRGAPLLGEHTDEVLEELGYSESMRRELRTARITGSEYLCNKG
ncbi:carnitine dehydratase [Variovorax sp. WS11]|uniref:CaiB/BaiF CoA transferase family protein n=1 Tax=Variovorax sp. WS11 TaxID=1105204 RepID=UPI000D0D0D9E|nr:CoA transferase [Variovorax sp. WS11]NDZ17413.1 CoA transferase [Variovorax sp. WS11]PSL86052.1 carnitine dehydratase [Variovorax sp. WS11]